ncbi:MAG: hypothetical protein H6705_06390 [Myxococcales bacterium]|nr:hypothetical protein [Myxococcales bacterium]
MTPWLIAWILATPPAPTAAPPRRPTDPARAATAAKTTPTTHALFGVVTEQAPLHCDRGAPGDPPTERWGAPYYEIGFVRLVDPAFDPKPLVGRPVLALGTPRDGPAPDRPDNCLAHQMRSDWIYGKSGIRVRRTHPPHTAFHPSSVTPLGAEVLSAHRTGDQIEITFHNPLDRPLTDLVLTLHHEGCYGKPLAAERAAATPALPPGEAFTARLPAIVDIEGRRGTHHAAAAVTITATGEAVGFDLDVPLAALGAAVACPDEPPAAATPPDPGD